MPSSLHCRWLLVCALGLGLSPLVQPTIAMAAAIEANDVVSPLVATPLTSPNPVLGADDKVHLAYEIVHVNMAAADIGLKKVETLDAASGAVLGTMAGDELAQMLKFNGASKGTTLSGGNSGILFMDVALPKETTVPKSIKHRFDIEVAKTGGGQGGSDPDPAPEPPQALVFTGDPLQVGPAAVVIAPPLKGRPGPPAAVVVRLSAIIAARRCRSTARSTWPSASPSISCRSTTRTASQGPNDKCQSYAYFGDEIYASPTARWSHRGRAQRGGAGQAAGGRTITMPAAIMSSSTSARGASPFTPICSREACA